MKACLLVYHQELVAIKLFIQTHEELVSQDPESMMYYSLFQKTALNQIKESLATLQARKEMIKKRSNFAGDWNMNQKNSNFDITLLSSPCLIGLTNLRTQIITIDCNMAFVSKIMLPKISIINQDLLNFAPKSLRQLYRQNLIDILRSEAEGFTQMIFMYRGNVQEWRKYNCEVRRLKQVGNLVQFAIILMQVSNFESGPLAVFDKNLQLLDMNREYVDLI